MMAMSIALPSHPSTRCGHALRKDVLQDGFVEHLAVQQDVLRRREPGDEGKLLIHHPDASQGQTMRQPGPADAIHEFRLQPQIL